MMAPMTAAPAVNADPIAIQGCHCVSTLSLAVSARSRSMRAISARRSRAGKSAWSVIVVLPESVGDAERGRKLGLRLCLVQLLPEVARRAAAGGVAADADRRRADEVRALQDRVAADAVVGAEQVRGQGGRAARQMAHGGVEGQGLALGPADEAAGLLGDVGGYAVDGLHGCQSFR